MFWKGQLLIIIWIYFDHNFISGFFGKPSNELLIWDFLWRFSKSLLSGQVECSSWFPFLNLLINLQNPNISLNLFRFLKVCVEIELNSIIPLPFCSLCSWNLGHFVPNRIWWTDVCGCTRISSWQRSIECHHLQRLEKLKEYIYDLSSGYCTYLCKAINWSPALVSSVEDDHNLLSWQPIPPCMM